MTILLYETAPKRMYDIPQARLDTSMIGAAALTHHLQTTLGGNSATMKERSVSKQLSWPPLAARGFTRTDLMVVIAILSILAAIMVAHTKSAKEKTSLVHCTANLQKITAAITSFSNDHEQTFPGPDDVAASGIWWFYKEEVKSYLGLTAASSPSDTVFACPGDRGYSDPIPFYTSPHFDYGSYVFNGVTLPGIPNIAGWKVTSVRKPSRTLLVMEWTAHAPLSWHGSKTGPRNMPFYCDAQSVVGFVDGHVHFSKIYYDGYNAAYTRDPIPGYDYQYSGN